MNIVFFQTPQHIGCSLPIVMVSYLSYCHAKIDQKLDKSASSSQFACPNLQLFQKKWLSFITTEMALSEWKEAAI